MSLSSSLWAYPWDIADRGIDVVVDEMVDRIGIDDLAVAAMYHSGKFLLPHNPLRRVYFPKPGTRYFEVSGETKLPQPRLTAPTWEGAAGNIFWASLGEMLRERGATLTAWCLGLHNSGAGERYPECAVENAFGDSILTDLCANNPDVVAYLEFSVAEAAAATGADRVILESFEFMPFEHGYHHEVIGVPVDPGVSILLSLCFCSYCAEAAREHGVDVEGLRSWVRSQVDSWLADPFVKKAPFDWSDFHEGFGGHLGQFMTMRSDSVTKLIRRVSDAVRRRSNARIGLTDFGPLYASGPDGTRWQSGLDLSAVSELVDELHPTFYASDKQAFSSSIEEYLAVAPSALPIHAALRAILPQTTDRSSLLDQVRALNGRFDGVSFYNYGFMAPVVFPWIRDSLISSHSRADRLEKE